MQALESPLVWGTEPQAHWRPHQMLSCIQTSLSFRLFFWRFQWPLPLLKDLSAPLKESKHFFELPRQIPGLVHLALLNIHRHFRVYINSVTDSFNEKNNGKITPIWTVIPSLYIILTCPEHFFEYQNVADWEHVQAFSPGQMDVFCVCSRCTKKNISIILWTRNAHRTLDECVRRSKCNSDAWNAHQDMCFIMCSL